ncbi:MAG: MarR family transcriptional regulator [Planctomycetes bacterium]|nr:MarR family transcriptional regulator [Planctomycetota bacterium]
MSNDPVHYQSVRQAIRQNQPFRSLRHEAMVALLLTTDELRRPMQQLLATRDGLTHQQYNVLRILRGARGEGLPTLEIAERMIERTPGVTRLLDRLEAKGLVRRERSAKDRRQVFCYLSAAGEVLVDELDAPVEALDDQLFATLPDGQVRALIDVLDRLRHHARRYDSARPADDGAPTT